MLERIKVAAAQVAPVYMDKAATIEKVCEVIGQVADNGASLVVFPETMIPGYPYWRSAQPNKRWAELMVEYQRNAVLVGSDDTLRIGAAAARHNVAVVIGCSEASGRPGSGTLYNTLLFFDRDGSLLGRHRKVMPTHAERLIWGYGDGSTLRVYPTSLGRIGGLICFEHHMTPLKAALNALGEEIHCAVWPGWYYQEQHPSIKRRWQEGDSLDGCDILHAVREYAFETQTFVVSASQYVADADLPDYAQGFNIAAGGSMIVNATGLFLAEPVMGKEAILYAEIDPAERMAMKAYFDSLGHYSRWDITQVTLHRHPLGPLADGSAPSVKRHMLSGLHDFAELPRSEKEQLSETYHIDPAQLDRVVDLLINWSVDDDAASAVEQSATHGS